MSIYWKVEVTPLVGKTWDNTQTTILRNIRNPLVTLRRGDALGTFEFKVSNVRDKYLSLFKPRDRIIIRRAKKWSQIDDLASVLIVGIVKEVPVQKTSGKDEITIEGTNFTDVISNALMFGDFTNTPINEAFQQAINSINLYIDNPDDIANRFAVTWDTNNPPLNTDGNPFPVVGEILKNRPFRYLVNKYSTAQATRTVRYYSHVSIDNKFVWRPELDDVDYEFGDSDSYVHLKKDLDIDGIVNLVIVKGGYDIYGVQIQAKASNLASQNKYGQKPLFVPTIAQDAQVLNQRDMLTINEPSRFPFPTAGASFTTTWKSSVTGNYVTVTTNEQYNNALVAHMKRELQLEGDRILQGREFGIFTLEVGFKPMTRGWFLADVIQFNITGLVQQGLGLTKLLRVNECTFSHTKDTFLLREDIGTV